MAALTEAKDSLAKASTPEPFSTSKTSNWVAKGGGLPPYIQHIAHDLVEKRGKSESNAIQMAIGICKNWCSGQGKVDKDTRAAACKAVAQWEKLKAKNTAKSATEAAWMPGLLEALDKAVEDARYRLALNEGLSDTLTDGEAGLRAHDRACGSVALLVGEKPRDRRHALALLHEAALWDRIALIDSVPKPHASPDELAEAKRGRAKPKPKPDPDADGDDDSGGAGDDDGDAEAFKALVAKFVKRGMKEKAARAMARNVIDKKAKKATEGAHGGRAAGRPFSPELDLSEFLGAYDESKHPRLHGKFASKLGAVAPGRTVHLGGGVHVQAPHTPGQPFTVKLTHSSPARRDEYALARDADHAAAIAVHARRHGTLRGAGSDVREAFGDFRAELHPRDRLGKFRGVPTLPRVDAGLDSLPGPGRGRISSVSRPHHTDSPALGAQYVPHSPGRPDRLEPMNGAHLTPTDIEQGVSRLEHRSGESREVAGHTVTALPSGDYHVRGPRGESTHPTASRAAQHVIDNRLSTAQSPVPPDSFSQAVSLRRALAPRPTGTDPAEWDSFIRQAPTFGDSQDRMNLARQAGVDFGEMNGLRERQGDHLPGSPQAESPGRPTYGEGPDGEDFNDAQYGGGEHHSIRVQRGSNQGGDRVLSVENDNGRAVLTGPESNARNASAANLTDLGEWPQGGDVTRRTLSKNERQQTFGSELPEALELPSGDRVEVYHKGGYWVHTRPGEGGKREVVASGEVATKLRAPRPPKGTGSRSRVAQAQAHAGTLKRAAENYDLVELTLHSGGHRHGNVTSVEGDGVHMEGGDGQEFVVPLHRIKAVEKIDA